MKRVLIADDDSDCKWTSASFQTLFPGWLSSSRNCSVWPRGYRKKQNSYTRHSAYRCSNAWHQWTRCNKRALPAGGTKAFILVTAYERFDIAREALSMGVCDYLLKPVSKERLEIALQAASSYLDRIHILEEKELEFKENQQKLLPFVKTAFFVYLRQQRGAKDREPRETKRTKALRDELNLYKEVLHISGEAGVMGIASFSPADGLANLLYEYFCSALQYKTIALAGPLEDNRYCAWFLPLKSKWINTAAEAEVTAFLELLSSSFHHSLQQVN